MLYPTIFEFACEFGDLACVQAYLDCGLNVKDASSLLFSAFENHHFEITAKLVQAGVNLDKLHVSLHDFVIRESEAFDRFEDEGLDASYWEENTDKPHAKLISYLMDLGAEVNIINPFTGKTPLDQASELYYEEAVVLLKKNGGLYANQIPDPEKRFQYPLIQACQQENVEWFFACLQEKMDLQLIQTAFLKMLEKIDQQPLSEQQLQILHLLLEKGANPNLNIYYRPDSVLYFDRILVHLAVKNQERERLDVLLKHKAKVNLLDRDGLSALDWAIQKGDAEIIQLLKRHGGLQANELPTDQREYALSFASAFNRYLTKQIEQHYLNQNQVADELFQAVAENALLRGEYEPISIFESVRPWRFSVEPGCYGISWLHHYILGLSFQKSEIYNDTGLQYTLAGLDFFLKKYPHFKPIDQKGRSPQELAHELGEEDALHLMSTRKEMA